MKAISLRLENEQYKRLRLLSYTENKPMSQMIREAVDVYLQERTQPKPGQEWFWTAEWQAAEQETETDLAAGRYETFDSMEAFLDSLE